MTGDEASAPETQAIAGDTADQATISAPTEASAGTDAEVSTDPSIHAPVLEAEETTEPHDSSTVAAEPIVTTEKPQDDSTDAAAHVASPSIDNVDRKEITGEPLAEAATVGQNDTDFVPPDMEHIVSTGADQDAASSMQALRDLVAQARASSGQQREALPPGFSDEVQETDSSSPQGQRGEKRKAEDELEQLVEASAGIEQVKAAAEQSQHPETKTLLQKALSSISGLVSRRSKTDSAPSSPAPISSDQNGVQQHAKPSDVGEEADASDDESSSDSDSSSSDSSDEDEDDEAGRTAVAAAIDDDDDEEGGGPSSSAAPVTKNEILAPDVDQPAIQQVTEAEKQTLRKLGKVHSIVDSVVVVEQDVQQARQADGAPADGASVPVDSTGRQGERQGEYSVLDTGSLLCFEDGKVLGLVFETFGSIHNPMYSIRFASAAAIDRELVQAGKTVFYLPAQSTYVLTQLLRQMKGSDASNMWDEEVADDEIDYSDDEQEAEAKRRAKAIRSGQVDDEGNPLPAPSARGNKRQKQQGSDYASNSSARHPANGSFSQRSGPAGSVNNAYIAGQQASQQRPNANNPASLPKRSVGGPNLPLPPAPARPASSGPALPQGKASLPPRPSAGLPSKPSFASGPSEPGNGAPSTHMNVGSAPRSRMGSTDSSVSGPSHSRMNSAAASSLPAKPVDAAAAAAASASSPHRTHAAASASPYGASSGVAGASSPPHTSRLASMRNGPSAPAGAHQHQSSPAWYGGSPSVSAPPAASSHYGAYSTGAGGPVAVQGGGHYNPAYAGHWQHSYGPAATSGPPKYQAAAGGHAWNGPASYQAPPLHLAPGATNQQYGGYGVARGGYGAPSGGQGGSSTAWNAQTYPGSHYPGYTDQQYYRATSSGGGGGVAAGHGNQAYYATSAQAYGAGSYPSQGANADAYPYQAHAYSATNAYGSTPSNGAARSTAQESYDPTSPALGSGNGQNQHGASSS